MSRKGSDLKQRIVDRALELFNEHGLEGVGMRELARDLALAPGNLTYHFARKEELILAIAARFSADNTAILAPDAGAPTFTRFFDTLQPAFRNQYRYRCLTLNIVTVLNDYPELGARYVDNQELRRTQLEQWLRQLQAAGRLRPDLAERELDWLVTYCQMLGRTWMLEYRIFRSEQPLEQVVAYSLSLLAGAFLPYAGATGREELAPYLEPLAPAQANG